MSSQDHDPFGLSKIKPERHKNGALSIHPYFGKVDPALAKSLIERFSRVGDTVLDPFCGSGTVLHEALLLKRSAVGWDSSQLAVLLSAAKLMGINRKEIHELAEISRGLETYGSKAGLFFKPLPDDRDIPSMPRTKNASIWFEKNAVNELGYIRFYLNQATPKMSVGTKLLAFTAFSRIIVSASNQQGESSYRSVKKEDYPGRVIDLYVDALHRIVQIAVQFNNLMQSSCGAEERLLTVDSDIVKITWGELKAEIDFRDTRLATNARIKNECLCDLVVTSPPYLMSWDYGLYHKFRFYWLGYDLETYEETEIGRHLRRKRDDVERYREDMRRAFVALSHNLKSSATIAMINANSVVHGNKIDTNAILGECADAAGWNLQGTFSSLDIPGPHHGMYASLESRGTKTAGKSGKKENVLIFIRG